MLTLENIIEVYEVDTSLANNVVASLSAFFKMSREFLETPQALILQKHGASIVNLYPDGILVNKSGCDADIRNLYNQLEGPHLLGFIQTGLIADTNLIDEEQSSVFSRAA